MTNMNELIHEFQSVTREEYGSYAFSSGYLGGMLADVLQQLPAKIRAERVNTLKAFIETSRSNVAMRELSSSVEA